MDSAVEKQVYEQLTKIGRVLVALPKKLQPDTLGSALGLALFLKKLNKEVDVVSSGEIEPQVKFLPGADLVKKNLDQAKSLVVVLNTGRHELDELSYQTLPDQVQIFLKPKDGSFSPQDITLETEKAPYATVIILDCQSLEDLGEVFENNAEVFYQTPKINIDHHSSNSFFGNLNLVDITASSTAEILADLFGKFEQQLIDEDIATCLLTGIIFQTNSFQHVSTTPKTFLKASELINFGGRQQEVIKNLFKTKTLPLLRLWGRALARLKIRDDLSLVFSQLNRVDFEKAEAGEQELQNVLAEMLENIDSYKVVGLLAETGNGGVKVLVAMHQQFSPQVLAQSLAGENQKSGQISLIYNYVSADCPATDLPSAESRFLAAVRALPGIKQK